MQVITAGLLIFVWHEAEMDDNNTFKVATACSDAPPSSLRVHSPL